MLPPHSLQGVHTPHHMYHTHGTSHTTHTTTMHTYTHTTLCTTPHTTHTNTPHTYTCVCMRRSFPAHCSGLGNSQVRRLVSKVSILELLTTQGTHATWTHALCSPQAYFSVLNVQMFFPLSLTWPVPPHPLRFSSDATSPRNPSQNPLLYVPPQSPQNAHPRDTYHTVPKLASQE